MAAIFPQLTSSDTNMAVAAQDRLLCSAGNDGAVVLWDLGASLCGDKAQDPSELFFPSESSFTTKSLESAMDGLELMTDQPKALFAWDHAAKPNWMGSSQRQDPVFPSSLFLADTTPDITVYTIRSA